MSKMNDLALALGGGVGAGVNAYYDEKEAQRLRKQQESDRARKMALEDFTLNQSLAPGLIESNPEAASHTLTAVMQHLRDAGYDVSVPNIVGGDKQVQRPSATPTAGPLSLNPAKAAGGLSMPQSETLKAVLGQKLGAPAEPGAPTDYAGMMTQGLNAGPSIGSATPLAPESVTVRDFSNPQTKAALMAGYGLGAATGKDDLVPIGGALYNIKTKQWLTPPTQLTAEDKKAAMAEKVKQAFEMAKDKRDFDLKMKEMGISASTSLALLRIANAGKGGSKGKGGFDVGDPNDVATLENKLMEQAKAKMSVPYPQDKVDRKGRDRPDGMADGMDNVPIAAARNAWSQSVDNLYQSLRTKHGLKAETD